MNRKQQLLYQIADLVDYLEELKRQRADAEKKVRDAKRDLEALKSKLLELYEQEGVDPQPKA